MGYAKLPEHVTSLSSPFYVPDCRFRPSSGLPKRWRKAAPATSGAVCIKLFFFEVSTNGVADEKPRRGLWYGLPRGGAEPYHTCVGFNSNLVFSGTGSAGAGSSGIAWTASG